jgi:type IV pilus assembly protein PilY1
MNTRAIKQAIFAFAALALASVAHAEDINLFKIDPTFSADRPNVLIIIDNQSNWTASSEWPGQATKQQRIREAAIKVLLESEQLVDRVNVGILNIGGNHRQSKVIEGIRPLTAARQESSTLRDRIIDMSDGWWSKASNSDYGLVMNEAYKYFTGRTAADYPNTERDASVVDTAGNYIPPEGEACAGNFIIFIATGFPRNDFPLNNRRNARDGSEWAPNHLKGYGGNTNIIPLTPNRYEESMADEFARFMASDQSDVLIRTHVIDVFNPARSELAQRVFWRSVAQHGRGDYYDVETTEELEAALTMTFDRILAVNSVFAASSLPVSVNVRGTHLNQVYMGVFRPDADFDPSWHGNLKLYQLAQDSGTGNVYFADRTGTPAQSGNFVRDTARSFWTTAGIEEAGFWRFHPDYIEAPFDDPDGHVVEKGGAAQRAREQVAARLTAGTPLRNLFTCDTDCSDLAWLSTATSSLSEETIAWLTGKDIDLERDEEIATVRPSLHGDVLHSRPAVLNYSADPNDVVVFYGANDGAFRAVRGGRVQDGLAPYQAGEEIWAFVAPEFFDTIDNLRENVHIDKPLETSSGKPYYMDGGIGLHFELVGDDVSKAWIFPSMRRGGRSIYAFDVSTPEEPNLMWRIAGGGDDEFKELAQTWSEPRATRTLANDGKPVLIFGAGYDADAEDALVPMARTKGRGIFVIDAETGDHVWSVGGPESGATVEHEDMLYSIPSDVTIIRRSDVNRVNRVADRLYVGDTGGNVWRIDINSANVADWRVHRIAALGAEHKFLHAPDVVYGALPGRLFDAILIGSGDREKPHDAVSENAFFMVRDFNTDPRIHEPEEIDPISIEDLYPVPSSADGTIDTTLFDEAQGWALFYGAGEKTVGGVVTLSGTVYFSTHQPGTLEITGNSCAAHLGIARNYAISFLDASTPNPERYTTVPGGGFVPSPVAVLVPIVDPETGEERLVEGVLRGTQFDESEAAPLLRRHRTFWFTEHDG